MLIADRGTRLPPQRLVEQELGAGGFALVLGAPLCSRSPRL
jgi:hypothetical protein